jgi:glycine dehydrogenase
VRRIGLTCNEGAVFDTLTIEAGDRAGAILDAARQRRMNLRDFGNGNIGIALDQTTTRGDVNDLLDVLAAGGARVRFRSTSSPRRSTRLPRRARPDHRLHDRTRRSKYHTEHELLRYITRCSPATCR